MSSLQDRLKWLIIESRSLDPDILVEKVIAEIESTHRIIDPDMVTDAMLDACFCALPEHYDPPDPKRRAWHAFKAKRRYSAMVRASSKMTHRR